MRPSPRASAHRRCSSKGCWAFGFIEPADCRGLGRTSVLPGLRKLRLSGRALPLAAVFGPGIDRVQRSLRGSCSQVGSSRPRFGDGELLREISVRLRKPGCPADPGGRKGGAGRPTTLHFPAKATPLPRVGGAAGPGGAAAPRGVALRSPRPRPASFGKLGGGQEIGPRKQPRSRGDRKPGDGPALLPGRTGTLTGSRPRPGTTRRFRRRGSSST